jgi:hypothetical protein
MVYDAAKDTAVVISEDGKWIDPTNKNAPIDGGKHKAVKPEDVEAPNQKATKTKQKKKGKDKGFRGVKYSNLPEGPK